MMATEMVEGVGFAVFGAEESYLALVDEDGSERFVSAHQFLPKDGRVAWAVYEALTGGFSAGVSEGTLARHPGVDPVAYRMKVTVEFAPITREETRAVLDRVKRRREQP